VAEYRLGQAADLLGVSVDTLRRWADAGRLETRRSDGGHRMVEGAELARFLSETVPATESDSAVAHSARNRFPGIVTRVVRDTVMAQVEIRSGRNRIVALISREAADELGLEPGVLAVGSVKSTNVGVELPAPR
jgi:molybdopterin-binding protein